MPVRNYLVLYHSVIPSAKNCKAFRKALVCEESVEADSVECGQFSVAVRQVEKVWKKPNSIELYMNKSLGLGTLG